MFSYFSGVHCPVRYNVSHCEDGSCISADIDCGRYKSWWCHQMETFSALLTLCEGNPPMTGGFPSQRPVTRSFDVFFDLRLNKRLSKQSRRRWLRSHRTHYEVTVMTFQFRIARLIIRSRKVWKSQKFGIKVVGSLWNFWQTVEKPVKF